MPERILTDETKAQIIAMRKAGMGPSLIARKLGLTAQHVCTVYRRHVRANEPKPEPVKPAASISEAMGIARVSRRVVNRLSQCSVGHGTDYGYVMISLPRVSLIDGMMEPAE